MDQAHIKSSAPTDSQKSRWLFLILLAVICLMSFTKQGTCTVDRPLQLVNIRAVGDYTRTRLIAVFSGNPDYSMQLLDRPNRLVVNLPNVDFSLLKQSPLISGIVSDLRYGLSGKNSSRIILTTTVPFAIEKNKIEQLDNGLWQLIVDITRDSEENYQQLLEKQNKDNTTSNEINKVLARKPFRVVIDAGHGGIDSGAEGVGGTFEKEVTLAFSRALRDQLEKNSALQVYLTRDSDVFLRLNERVQKARSLGADLFISIHADTINMSAMRGATIYTISDQASDDLAKALAERENKADLLDGLPADESPEVTDILIDLARRETLSFSVKFADRVISNFARNNINLIKNPHRYAGFQVLKAPDIPSVLIEIGYLSNKEDEKLIADPNWRKTAAASIAYAVGQFANYRNGQQSNPQP